MTRIFGVPGEEDFAFMMALEDSFTEFILTRHEQGAAFMAEVQGRLRGEPGVCLGTLGPGAANLETRWTTSGLGAACLFVSWGLSFVALGARDIEPAARWARLEIRADGALAIFDDPKATNISPARCMTCPRRCYGLREGP